jgi:hypothetical protein
LKRWDVFFLFLAGLILPLLTAQFQESPGYMDAEYYYAGGLELASGRGFTEPFIWNYLDDPDGVPRPSHAYWMPLASLLAAAGMAMTGSTTFAASRIFFLLLAGLIPVATAALSWELYHQRAMALLAGALALLPGFYLPYLATSDTFVIYMLLGALWFLLIGRIVHNRQAGGMKWLMILGLGMTAGLMHLARADGILWFGLSCLFVLLEFRHARRRLTVYLIIAGIGYLLVMGPWMARNFRVLGAPLSPASARTLWLVDYDDLYIYPAAQLTQERWLDSGLDTILNSRLWALGQNIQSALAVQGLVFQVPLILLGIWRWRQDVRIRCGLAAWIGVLILMTVAFPFAGARGGFFHSGAALQPLFWALVPAGLEGFLLWGQRKRGWQLRQARAIFGTGLLFFAVIFTIYLSANRVGADREGSQWDASYWSYKHLDERLTLLGAQPQDLVLVNNIPGYYVAAGRGGASIPDGGVDALMAVAHRYQMRYLLLEANHPQGLNELYQQPGDRIGLTYLESLDDTHVFRIEP